MATTCDLVLWLFFPPRRANEPGKCDIVAVFDVAAESRDVRLFVQLC